MGEKVLDVGNGGIREFFSPVTSLYVGIDSSLDMLRHGKNGTTFRVGGDAILLPFKGNVFDTVFYRSLLHHLPERDMKKTLRQGFNSLKEEGNVIVIEPCLPCILE